MNEILFEEKNCFVSQTLCPNHSIKLRDGLGRHRADTQYTEREKFLNYLVFVFNLNPKHICLDWFELNLNEKIFFSSFVLQLYIRFLTIPDSLWKLLFFWRIDNNIKSLEIMLYKRNDMQINSIDMSIQIRKFIQKEIITKMR